MATYTLISSNVLASSAASVTFSAIPATYTDLVLKVSARNGDSGGYGLLLLTINGDTAGNYSFTNLRGNGAAASSTQNSAVAAFQPHYIDFSTNAANTFSSGEIYIPNYGVVMKKPISSFSVQEDNSASTAVNIGATAGLYQGTTAITSLTLTSSNTNFVATSSFYLYGISNA